MFSSVNDAKQLYPDIAVFLIGSCSIAKLPVGIKHFAQSEGEVLSSISPLDTDFRDLEVIGDAIGDRRIVLLGEASHGDGQAFLAKS